MSSLASEQLGRAGRIAPSAGGPSSELRIEPHPPGFRPEDFLDLPEMDGFVSVPEAAKRMERPESEVIELARRGVLSYRLSGATLYVRPAIFSGREG